MRRVSQFLVIILVLLGICLPSLPRVQAQDEVTWLHNQINSLRASLGIHGYALNPSLMAAAQAHSEWMATTGNISHTEDDGSEPGDRAAAHGYTGTWVSENIYGGMMGTAATAWNWWMNSPIHYAGITDARKNELGIGVYGGYYTLLFGIGSNVEAPPPPAEELPAPQPDSQQVPAQAALENQPQQPVQPAPAQPTWTPSPTIPTATPTVTWTPTFTWTPSPTHTTAPPSATAITLPIANPNEVAAVPTLTPTPSSTVSAIAADTDEQIAVEPQPDQEPGLVATAGDEEGGISLKVILVLLIVGQAFIIGMLIWNWFLDPSSA